MLRVWGMGVEPLEKLRGGFTVPPPSPQPSRMGAREQEEAVGFGCYRNYIAMKKLRLIFWVCFAGVAAARAEQGPMTIWYTAPAANWNQALPIGNGRLAAMVFGGIATEHIQFNEDTIWTGQPHDYSHPGASNYLAEIRQEIFDGKGATVYKDVIKSNFMSVPIRQCGYQPCGDLYLEFSSMGAREKREHDELSAVAGFGYGDGGGEL